MKTLVVGGYGAVGTELSRLLANDDQIELIIAGRSEVKAAQLAKELNATSRVLDVNNSESVAAALEGVETVVNCFVDVFEPSFVLSEAALERGLNYLDLAAVPVDYVDGILELDERARATGALLITSLGVNPGLPALLAVYSAAFFERIDSMDIFFTMGSKLEGLSPLSLRGVGMMMKTSPLQWRKGEWRRPQQSGLKRSVDASFQKPIYFGPAMITRDLVDIPPMLGAGMFTFWSGMEKMLQGIVFLLGIKFGGTKTHKRAERFLRILQWLGKGGDTTGDICLELIVRGEKDGSPKEQHLSLHSSEEYATAIAPAIVCKQLASGMLSAKGAFLPPQVVLVDDAIEALRGFEVHFEEHSA